VIGQCQPSSLDNIDADTKSRSNKLIYFNSVGFNGNQFLTDSAIDAGYTKQSIKPDASVIETGLASLVEQDVSNMIISAENTLLRILVNDGSARSIVKNMLSARLAVNYGSDIHWSCPEKQWLFDVLVDRFDSTSEEHTEPHELRTFLTQLPDAPPGAFSNDSLNVAVHQATLLPKESVIPNVLDVEPPTQSLLTALAPVDSAEFSASLAVSSLPNPSKSSSGSLDIFFASELSPIDSGDDDADVILGTRNALAVQEALVTLLWASMALKSKLLREKFVATEMKAFNSLSALSAEVKKPTLEPPPVVALSNSTFSALPGDEATESSPALDVSQVDLLQQLRETTLSLQSLQASTHRIRTRLLDESASTGIEGSISRALQLELASQLDDHVRAGWKHFPPPGINDAPYETELERMATDWGEWYEDDYIWTPGASAAMQVSPIPRMAENVSGDVSASDRESVDDFMVRINREWSDWVD
jgi:hypothetical protein